VATVLLIFSPILISSARSSRFLIYF